MKKNIIKTLALAGMAVLTMGTLAGCGSNNAETQAPDTKTEAGTTSGQPLTRQPQKKIQLLI